MTDWFCKDCKSYQEVCMGDPAGLGCCGPHCEKCGGIKVEEGLDSHQEGCVGDGNGSPHCSRCGHCEHDGNSCICYAR